MFLLFVNHIELFSWTWVTESSNLGWIGENCSTLSLSIPRKIPILWSGSKISSWTSCQGVECCYPEYWWSYGLPTTTISSEANIVGIKEVWLDWGRWWSLWKIFPTSTWQSLKQVSFFLIFNTIKFEGL